MKDKVLELTDSNFDAKVLKSTKVVLVDFWAPWCGPCKVLGPIIDELASEFDGKAIIGKLNVDNNSQISSDYNIRSIPTILIFKNGDIIESIQGALPKADLVKSLNTHL